MFTRTLSNLSVLVCWEAGRAAPPCTFPPPRQAFCHEYAHEWSHHLIKIDAYVLSEEGAHLFIARCVGFEHCWTRAGSFLPSFLLSLLLSSHLPIPTEHMIAQINPNSLCWATSSMHSRSTCTVCCMIIACGEVWVCIARWQWRWCPW